MAPQLQLQLHYTDYVTHNYNSTTLQLHLQLRYATLHPAVVSATIATTPQNTIPPPFGPSVDSLCHPCIKTTHLSYSVLSLGLLPPPCAALLVCDEHDRTDIDHVYASFGVCFMKKKM